MRIERGAAPLTAAVHAGVNDDALAVGRRERMRGVVLVERLERRAICGRRTTREIVACELLTRKGRRAHGKRLRGAGLLARQRQLRHGALFDGEQRRARDAVEQKGVPRLGDLRHGVDRLAVALHRDQHGRGRQVTIPQVVLEHLIVPQPLSRVGIERDDAVGVQVVAQSVGAVEVVAGRPGGSEHHAALRIECHATPRIGAAGNLPRIGWPRVETGFPRMGNGVEAPHLFAGGDVEGANVAGGTRQLLGHGAAHDEQIAVHHPRGRRTHRQPLYRAAESLSQINPPAVAKGANGLTRASVERIEPIAIVEEHTIAGNHHAAVTNARRGRRPVLRVEAPALRAGGGVERNHLHLGRGGIQHPVDHDGVGLHLRPGKGVLGVEGPRHFELLHVGR